VNGAKVPSHGEIARRSTNVLPSTINQQALAFQSALRSCVKLQSVPGAEFVRSRTSGGSN
jgi:hypothetical protein